MDSESRDIIDRLRCGDRPAFREVYWAHHRSVYGLAVRYLKDPELAEDAVQDVFMKLWLNRSCLDSEKSISSFLLTTLKNHVLNMIKSQQRRVLRHYEWTDQNRKRSLRPDEQLLFDDCEQIFREGFEQLPEQKQLIYRLKSVYGYSNEEIAHRLNVSIHTVKSQYYRASRFIREFVASRTN